MFKKMLLCVLTIVVITAKSQFPWPYTVPNTDWKKFFSSEDAVVSVPTALDANSNVYLAGYVGTIASANLIALKYDSTGVNTYTYMYNNGGPDFAKAIKVDVSGNAIIAGTSDGGATGMDFIIIKLDPTGSLVWAKRWDGGSAQIDEATDVAILANGDVVVTGRSQNASGNFDLVTFRLDAGAGNLMWASPHSYNGVGGLDESATGVVLSSDGQVAFITGTTMDISNGTDIVTYALDANTGIYKWSPVITNGAGNSNDKSHGIILCGGNITICGELDNTLVGSGKDATVIKYNGITGTIIFQNDYDAYTNDNRATGLAKDSTGNIGVISTAINSSIYEYHTNFFDSTGVQYAVNKESTGLGVSTTDPKLCNDTIAHHWYASGEALKATKDIFVYQMSPSGTTAWKHYVDGQNNDIDCATGIAVNGVGVVYVAALSKNALAAYDLTAIKINQTPVYFPPDIVSNEEPSVKHLYYENKGQYLLGNTSTLASEILFATTDEYPNEYFSTNRFSYKLHRLDTVKSGMDTTQRIDVNLYKSNPYATAYPFEPKQGLVNYMDAGLPNEVLDVAGYQRYFIPNIYPYIDLHYYSNENGIKMYYVIKPFANPNDIQWEIAGANSTQINLSGDLVVEGFNTNIIFDRPAVYTVNMLGQAIPLTSTVVPSWNNTFGPYGITVPAYNTAWPLIIEIDNGNAVSAAPSAIGNLDYLSFYGGSLDEGFKSIKVDKGNGEYVCLGSTSSWDQNKTFPVGIGTSITSTVTSTSISGYLGIAYFDNLGKRKSANIYGIPAWDMQPLDVIVNKNRITIIGNVNLPNSNFPAANPVNLTPGSYTNTTGPGFLLQFELNQINLTSPWSMNKVKWFTRLNGYAAGIGMKPNSKEIYVTSSINANINTPDLTPKNGALNLTSVSGTWNGQVSKFDSVGVRQWSSLIQIGSKSVGTNLDSRYCDGSNSNTKGDYYRKLRIDCDNYGFSIAGDLDTNQLSCPNRYNAALTNTFSGHYDGFISRFNSNDSITFAGYAGGSSDDVFNDVKITGPNEITVLGYSKSQEYKQLTKFTGYEYIDTTVTSGVQKIWINKYDTLGNKIWGTLFGGNTTSNSNGWNITKDNLNKLYFVGRTYNLNLAGINGGAVYNQLSPKGQVDTYILGFDSTNTLIWNTYIAGTDPEAALSIDFNPNGNRIMTAGLASSPAKNMSSGYNYFPCVKPGAPYTGIWYTNSINADINDQTVYAGPYDGYLGWFYTAIPVGIKEYFIDKAHSAEDLIQLFPNPTNDKFFIALDKSYNKNVKIDVYNQVGQLVYTQIIPEAFEKTIVPLTTYNMKNGIYIVTVSDNTKSTSKKLIIAGK